MSTTDHPEPRKCEECGAEAGEACRVYCTARPDQTNDEGVTTMSIRNAIETGYRLTNLREYPAMSQETIAYTATITKDGTKVGTVRNDGCGGADFADLNDREATEAFQAAATQTYPSAHSPFEAQEELLLALHSHALMAREMNKVAKKETPLQKPDYGDWLETGTYCTVPHPAAEQVEAEMVKEGRTDWRIWDRSAGDFRTIGTH